MAILRSVSSGQSMAGTFTIPKPPGAAAGDTIVAFQTTDAFGPANMTTPGGGTTWQLLGQRSATEWGGSKVWWKQAGPAEPASYTFRQTVGAGGIVVIVAISDTDGATPLIASTANADNDATVTCPALAPTSEPGVTLRWTAGISASASWSTPSGHTEQADRNISEATAALATRARPEAGSTGATTFTASGSTPLYSHGFTVDVGGTSGPPPEPPPSIPASTDVLFKAVFCDLLTDSYIATADLDGVSFSRFIGQPGPFQATAHVVNRELADNIAKIVPRWIEHPTEPDSLSTGPGRVVVHAYQNGVIWCTAVIWQADVDIDDRGAVTISMQGATLESYLNAVEIRQTYTYEGIDQLEVARGLITEMQALSSADIGLTLPPGSSGVNRNRTYLASEGGTFGQRLRELADTDQGFEWLIHTADPGTGARVREVRFGYPKLGGTTDHVFSQPGNILKLSQNIDALRGATSYRARGESVSTDASTSSTPLMSTPQNASAHLAAGWPRIDKTIDYSTVKEQSTLNAYAAKWAAERPGAVRVHQVTIKLDETNWTPAALGERARVIVVNDWWPIIDGAASFDHRWRVIGAQVTVTSRDSQPTAALVFEEELEI
ncbi:hypothetical protein HD597_010100 [Nonomuraea thailandensis]|uniref:Minor tail protein n=1 Tax=Nonomuraea thailandensis TaxID=1188745 RepID=A0A9X2GSD8_9ACTN|nr:hypothetical protein [Nonomuraea thailandensis]MCP2363080.1 hypothetical protein [Nonomuraea thailandensis]